MTTESKKDVHTEHCCLEHGCKYGKKNCTVATGKKAQSYPCEDCPRNGLDEMSDRLKARANEIADRGATSTIYWATILHGIIYAAAAYWSESDPFDFCIQSVSEDCIVFGGTNRLIWSPAQGYRPDRSYCNPKFLERCHQLGSTPGRYHRDHYL